MTVLASVSYVTATFMIEAIAGVNALKRGKGEVGASAGTDDEVKRSLEELRDSDDSDAHTEFVPLMVANEVVYCVDDMYWGLCCSSSRPCFFRFVS